MIARILWFCSSATSACAPSGVIATPTGELKEAADPVPSTEPIEPEPELIIPAALMEREDVAAMRPEKVVPATFAEVAGEEEAMALE